MLLHDLVDFARPFVLYKKPVSGQLHIWQQQNNRLYTASDIHQNGFFMHPFDKTANPVVFFPAEKSNQQTFLIREFTLNTTTSIKLDSLTIDEVAQQEHIKKVQSALEIISCNKVKKIVISRRQKVSFESFDSLNAVLKLMQTYENSMVYLWHHPQVGTWMGATPELLLRRQNNTVKTMALAGTLPVTDNQPVNWQSKEINEQQIVTDEIVSVLKKYSEQINISKPTTIYQGHLAHIKTDIEADIEPAALSNLINDLHPTPAVCGLPVVSAKKYINDIEQYDRDYYTGFLGIHSLNQTDFYVNLRSMSIFEKHLQLYIGGGIVAGSYPDKEWRETIIKSQILISALV